MRITWIGGWGVVPEALRPIAEMYFPKSEHTILAPTADCIRQVLECGGPPPLSDVPDALQKRQRVGAVQDAGADLLVAWSLGAWRMIEAASRGVEFPGMVLLLAPFVAFPSESGLGGKCSATQVKFLRRWLQRDPLAAIADFHQRAGLSGLPKAIQVGRVTPCTPQPETRNDGAHGVTRPTTATEPPYAMPDLLEGLDRLAEDASPALREFASRGMPRNWQALTGDSDSLLDGDAVCKALPGCTLVRGVGHSIADLLRASQA